MFTQDIVYLLFTSLFVYLSSYDLIFLLGYSQPYLKEEDSGNTYTFLHK